MNANLPPVVQARVLVVDDEDINRTILALMLQQAGHVVREASSGEQALKRVAQGDIDLVLMDLMMPGMDGLETCRRIKQVQGLLFLPVIFVTALHDRASRVECKAAGADDFLTKPVDPLELLARVGNLVKVKAFHDLQQHQQERLEVEVEGMRSQLLRADRLATLGNLAACVGHEIKNALSVLVGTLHFIAESSTLGEPAAQGDLDAIQWVAAQLDLHARHLLGFGRPAPEVQRSEDLRDLVRSTLEMLRVVGKTKRFEVRTVLPETSVRVLVDRIRIEQVLVNLINNAVDSFDGVSSRSPQIELELRQDAQDAGNVRCTVRDNGAGIPAEVMERLFQPYFTTKQIGNGLGLPVVKMIVESYGGEIAVESRVGEGTCFSFTLPCCSGT
jgi:signal transduction histidine kinase